MRPPHHESQEEALNRSGLLVPIDVRAVHGHDQGDTQESRGYRQMDEILGHVMAVDDVDVEATDQAEQMEEDEREIRDGHRQTKDGTVLHQRGERAVKGGTAPAILALAKPRVYGRSLIQQVHVPAGALER